MEDFRLAPPDDPLYVVREADAEFERALREKHTRPIVICGPSSTGKSALLARGVKGLRAAGHHVVLIDLASAPTERMTESNLCRFSMMEAARQLGLSDPFRATNDAEPPVWDERRSPTTCLERYLRRCVFDVMGNGDSRLYWCLDGLDRLETAKDVRSVGQMAYGWLLANWMEPERHPQLQRLRMIQVTGLSSATRGVFDIPDEAFVYHVEVGMSHLTPDEVSELNRRCGTVLRDPGELERFQRLFGGQPFLVRAAFDRLSVQGGGLAALEQVAERDDAPWAGFLEMLTQRCEAMPDVKGAVQAVLRGIDPADLAMLRKAPVDRPAPPPPPGCPELGALYFAQCLGLLTDIRTAPRFSCDLYRRYFARRYGTG